MNFAFEIRRESNPRGANLSDLIRSSTFTTRPTVYIRLEPNVPIVYTRLVEWWRSKTLWDLRGLLRAGLIPSVSQMQIHQSHIWSPVTHMNGPCHTNEWVIFHISMSHDSYATISPRHQLATRPRAAAHFASPRLIFLQICKFICIYSKVHHRHLMCLITDIYMYTHNVINMDE